MKKLTTILLVLALILSLGGCAGKKAPAEVPAAPETIAAEPVIETLPEETEPAGPVVLTYLEYLDTVIDTVVTVETYVQASQTWWDDTISLYCQGPDGAYFLYGASCTEEEAAKLVPGTKITVTGLKTTHGGEVEILQPTLVIDTAAAPFLAEAADLTELLGSTELEAHQNELAAFKGLTVEKIEFENEEPGDDIHLTLGYNGSSYPFLVEIYLTGTDSEVYTAVETLEAGDLVDVEAFLCWSEDQPVPHVTAIAKAG